MAFTPMGDFTFNHVDNIDKPNKPAATNKSEFDSRGAELKTALNGLITELEAVTNGASGADNIGMTPITETGANATVQSVIEALITRLKAVTDSASGADLIGATAIAGLTGGTVQALLEALDSAVSTHLAETAPHAELTNRTITVGSGKDFATIQAAINSIKKRVDATITINVDAGTYNETVIIAGFVGAGNIIINGGTNLATAVNYVVKGFNIYNNALFVAITGFTANTTTTHAIVSEGNTRTYFYYCIVSGTATSYSGFYIASSLIMLYGCQVSNRDCAVYAFSMSTVFSRDWTAGSGNTIGLAASEASTIGKYGTQPQGTTAESAVTGGIIR